DRPVVNESPSLVDLPKASKAARNNRIGPRRRSYISVDGGTSRRSRRTRPPVPSKAEDLTRTASTNLSQRVLRQRPRRNVANNVRATRSSVKPQGVLKRQPTKTTRGNVREK
ncbi:hypothetical protein BJ875DRAFT_390213, partial [Amylocarpus encephaloides]